MKKVLTFAKQHIMLFVGFAVSLSIYLYISTTRIAQSALRLEISIASVVMILAGILSLVMYMRKPAQVKESMYNGAWLVVWVGIFMSANIFLLGGIFQYTDDNIAILICGLFSIATNFVRSGVVAMEISNFWYFIIHAAIVYISTWQVGRYAKAAISREKANRPTLEL